ncbi:partner of Y14 and mago protein [Sarcoptes scabiei]|nr:partner of Y14 and mago protein [Sarcoptes scabiei]
MKYLIAIAILASALAVNAFPQDFEAESGLPLPVMSPEEVQRKIEDGMEKASFLLKFIGNLISWLEKEGRVFECEILKAAEHFLHNLNARLHKLHPKNPFACSIISGFESLLQTAENWLEMTIRRLNELKPKELNSVFDNYWKQPIN